MKRKKLADILLTGILVMGLLSGCGSSGQGSDTAGNSVGADNASGNTSVSDTASAEKEDTGENISTENGVLNEDEEITLHLFGPGLLASQGETGALDMITGLETPGYEVIEARWNELHPNVHLEIEAAPWDNWQSAVQTAALGGELDVILHGATLTALVEPLDSFLAEDSEFRDKIYTTETRRTTDVNDLSVATTTGIPYTLQPQIAYLDKQIFDNYGVEVPDASWTWSDMLALAEKLTGTDPVTGKQTYGVQLDSMDNANNSFFSYQMIASAYDAKVFQYGKTVEDSTVNFENDKTEKVFQMIQDLGKYTSSNVKEGMNISYQLTADNDTAIRYSQDAFTHFKEANEAGISDKFVFLPMPVIEEGSNAGNPSSFKGCNNMAICNTSKNKEWAWEFIKFMVTDPECVQWVIDCGQVPNTPDGMDSVMEIMGDKADAIVISLEGMPDDFSNSTTEYYNNISFGPIVTSLGVVTHDLVNGTISPAEAARQMQKTVDEYLATQ